MLRRMWSFCLWALLGLGLSSCQKVRNLWEAPTGQEQSQKPDCVAEYLVGGARTCAKMTDGSYRCRGRNNYFQSTHGNWPGLPPPNGVVAFPGPWDELQVESQKTLGLREGKLWYWGVNVHENLIAGLPSKIQKPVLLDMLPGATKLFHGDATVCSLNNDDQLWCKQWSGPVEQFTNLPHPVVQIEASRTSVCARSESAVHCRGGEAFLNDGPDADVTKTATVFRWGPPKLVPIEGLPANDPIVDLAMSCALTESGALWCWGTFPGYGIYPPGTEERCKQGCPGENFRRAKRVDVPPLKEIDFLSGLGRDGKVYIWGGYVQRALNDGQYAELHHPVKASLLGQDNAELLAGLGHLCVIKTDQRLVCIGDNSSKEIQDEHCKDDICPPTEVEFACE